MKSIDYFASMVECRTHGYWEYSTEDIRDRLKELAPCLGSIVYEAQELLQILKERALSEEELELDEFVRFNGADIFLKYDDDEEEDI